MKVFWDTSAVINAVLSPTVKGRLKKDEHFYRPHLIAEFFCVMCAVGVAHEAQGIKTIIKMSKTDAVAWLREFADKAQAVELTSSEILKALENYPVKAKAYEVFDFGHCLAAEKIKADILLTRDIKHFEQLGCKTKIEWP